MKTITVKESVAKFLNSFSPNVLLVAAAKTRTPEEVKSAINAGAD